MPIKNKNVSSTARKEVTETAEQVISSQFTFFV